MSIGNKVCWYIGFDSFTSPTKSLPELSGVPIIIFSGFFLFMSILFTDALNLSSWALKAFNTDQITLYVSLSFKDSSGFLFEGIRTGIIIYPYFLFGAFLMTLPTDWTTSTWEFLDDKNKTASRFGTSTPSLKHLALVNTLHSLSPLSSFNHESNSSLSSAFIPPSICLEVMSTIFLWASSFNEEI